MGKFDKLLINWASVYFPRLAAASRNIWRLIRETRGVRVSITGQARPYRLYCRVLGQALINKGTHNSVCSSYLSV